MESLNADSVSLAGVPLQNFNVDGLILRKANMPNSDFRDASLNAVDFTGSYLGVADFRGARLIGVKFLNADLKLADFRGSDVFVDPSYFDDSNLIGANFSGATINEPFGETSHLCGTILPDGQTSDRNCNQSDKIYLLQARDERLLPEQRH